MKMIVRELPQPQTLARAAAIRAVSLPTIGHYLEEGFVDPEIRMLVGDGSNVAGPAVTVRTTATDSTALHHAAGMIEDGQFVVIDTGGDRFHAPLGEVVATQLQVRGAAGVIVDGVVTDIEQLRRIGLPVYARGTSLLTTKLLGAGGGGIGMPISCGGVTVSGGDIVLADANGALVLAPEALDEVLDEALADDASEPELLAAVSSGQLLGQLTGATELVSERTRAG